MNVQTFTDLPALARHLRDELENMKFILLYAYNGVGKTRLSTEFKNLGKTVNTDGESAARGDTLYFNAFTEDLFTWNNDLENDSERVLRLNAESRFFDGLAAMEMDNRVRPLLDRYADFDFRIDTEKWEVSFSREITEGKGHRTEDGIKVSRGEENIFIWCFFLAIVQLVLDDDGSGPYGWVKYIYIDDPISSLDDQNAVAVATHLARMLKTPESPLKTVISTHHALFFNVLCNEIKRKKNRDDRFFLARDRSSAEYILRDTGDTPFFHHVAALVDLYEAEQSGELYTHHFNMLRAILEKTASFHGYDNFSACIKRDEDDLDSALHVRLVNILNHGNYSLYEPREMLEENKEYFRKILHDFIERYPFNPALFPNEPTEKETS
jgi:hypothetical protein